MWMKIKILFGIIFLISFYSSAQEKQLSDFEIISGVNETNTKDEWDQRFLSKNYIFGKKPAEFLKENIKFLSQRSTVLDMGMGEGRNAVFLASKGHHVVGVDISSVAVQKANSLAREFSTEIKGVVASLDSYQINDGSFDVILCFYYVDRKLISKMKKWLKPGGIIFYEAHTMEKLSEGKLLNKNYLVKKGEIKEFFSDMAILKFEEPNDGSFRSSIIVKKSQ